MAAATTITRLHLFDERSGFGRELGRMAAVVPAAGLYEIEMYAPYCDTNSGETKSAIYAVNHAGGQTHAVVDQEAELGLWTSLGQFDLLAGSSTLVRLTDHAPADLVNFSRAIWFDAIRLRPSPDPPSLTISNSLPHADFWSARTSIDFVWNINVVYRMAGSTLQVASDPDFDTIVYETARPGSQNNAVHDFSQEYAALYWRVSAQTTVSGTVNSAITQFGIDTTPPTSAVTDIYQLPPRRLHPGLGGK